MSRKIFISFLIVAFFSYINGCYTATYVNGNNLEPGVKDISEVKLVDGSKIQFPRGDAKYESGECYFGVSPWGGNVLVRSELISGVRTRLPQSVVIDKSTKDEIKEIILKNNKRILPIPGTVRYNPSENLVYCSLINEKDTAFWAGDVQYAFTEVPEIQEVSALKAEMYDSVVQIVSQQGKFAYTFDSSGVRKDSVLNYVTGTGVDGMIAVIIKDEIEKVKKLKLDINKTSFAIAAPLAVLLGIWLWKEMTGVLYGCGEVVEFKHQ